MFGDLSLQRLRSVGLLGLIALMVAPGFPALGSDDSEELEESSSGRASTVYRIPVSGIIDLGVAPLVIRALETASSAEADAVVLEIDTFGGRVDAAVQIRDALLGAEIKTIAFIHPRAISAGALISLGCEVIVMSPGGSIGAATPVTGAGTGEMEAAEEKVVSYMRAEMRSTAERRGRRGDVAEAMVDRDIEIEDLIAEGKLLTLTTEEAVGVGYADFVANDLARALSDAGLPGAEVIDMEMNWAETFARAISNPVLSGFLLSIGFLGIVVGIYQPGMGFPEGIGVTALILFFFGHTVVNLAGLEEMLLVLVGLALLAVEIFVIPGFGIAGIAGILCIGAGAVLAMLGLSWEVSWELGYVSRAATVFTGALLGAVVGGFLAFRFLPRSKVIRPFVLATDLGADVGYTSHDPGGIVPIGTAGVAASDLRPAGRIRVGGKRIDAISEGGFVSEGTRVHVVGWSSGNAVVRPEPEEEGGPNL